MRHWFKPICLGALPAALLVVLCSGLVCDRLASRALAQAPVTTEPSARAAAAYRHKLKAYIIAHGRYAAKTKAYWTSVAEKRRERNRKRLNKEEILLADYVLAQPPAYSGPPRPVDPLAPKRPPGPKRYIPVAADFLKAAKLHFDFVPKRPKNELEYKRAYARVASTGGLTRSQVVRIYAFECGGNGRYDVQAGLEYSRSGRAISTALGYNQLLHINSVSLMAEQGDQFVRILEAKAAHLSEQAKAALERKIAIVRRMVAFSRTVPVRWSEHTKLADTPRGLALHAMNFDIDVGPLLQARKLLASVRFARHRGITRTLTAAELELMNFTGDGNGFDMVTMPHDLRRQVPTANFFVQQGYERNSIARRYSVVAELVAAIDAKMTRESKHRGARDMAAAFPK